MPKPRPNESQDDFLDRCIPEVVAEGKDPDQAVAMCVAYYEGYNDKAFDVDKANHVEYFKAFDRRREMFLPRYERLFRKAFKEQLSVFEDAYTPQDFDKRLDPKPIEQAYEELYTDVGDNFARNTWAGMKRMPYAETKQNPAWLERLIKIARFDASKRIEGVNKETKRRINQIIQMGLQAGLSLEEIKDRIIGTRSLPPLNGTVLTRARRIARTEIISASNAGSFFGAEATGLVFQKEWLSTADDRSREDHLAMSGVRVGKNDPFVMPDYSELQYPGDPAGEPHQVINCRCTQIYITED